MGCGLAPAIVAMEELLKRLGPRFHSTTAPCRSPLAQSRRKCPRGEPPSPLVRRPRIRAKNTNDGRHPTQVGEGGGDVRVVGGTVRVGPEEVLPGLLARRPGFEPRQVHLALREGVQGPEQRTRLVPDSEDDGGPRWALDPGR